MRFAERTIALKDGRTCILKPATPDLAEEMIEYMKKTAIETPFLTRYPDEISDTADHEREFLAGKLWWTENWRGTAPCTVQDRKERSGTAA